MATQLTQRQLKPDMGATGNLLKNSNFINNSTNGYGGTPDDWTNASANPVQGGFPSMTKQQLIDLLGITDGNIEGLWNLNEASGNATDLSSNGYTLTETSGTIAASSDGLMGIARDFEAGDTEYFVLADASCPNLEISGSQTWFGYYKPESIGANQVIMSKRNSAIKQLYLTTAGIAAIYLQGLTTNVFVTSDVVLEAGKWYFICGVYDSVNSKLKIWVNGIKKELTASGSATDSNGDFEIGAYAGANDPADGLIQNCGVLSVALTDTQVKKLFAATLYRGVKIRRATGNGILSQLLPESEAERLRGKTVTLTAKMWQDTASVGQLQIYDGIGNDAFTTTTTGSWVDAKATLTIASTATYVEVRMNGITSDGNVWFKELTLYEGSSPVYTWYPSYDDIARFPRLLRMEPYDSLQGYKNCGYGLLRRVITSSNTTATSTTVIATSKIAVVVTTPIYVKVTVNGTAQNNTDTTYYLNEITKDGVSTGAVASGSIATGTGRGFTLYWSELLTTAGSYEYGYSIYGVGSDQIAWSGCYITIEMVPA